MEEKIRAEFERASAEKSARNSDVADHPIQVIHNILTRQIASSSQDRRQKKGIADGVGSDTSGSHKGDYSAQVQAERKKRTELVERIREMESKVFCLSRRTVRSLEGYSWRSELDR